MACMSPRTRSSRAAFALLATVVLVAAGCSDGDAPAASEVSATTSTETDETDETDDFYDGDVHDVSVEFDQADLDAALADYRDRGEKTWIEVTVTIDGRAYPQSGMRLKGNSSLAGLGGGFGPAGGPGGPGIELDCTAAPGDAPGNAPDDTVVAGLAAGVPPAGPGFGTTSDAPEDLPWLIRLDKYVDEQAHQGRTDFVVRSNITETALNEAVSLDLLGEAGLATQLSAPVRFSANGSDPVLRLVIEHPDDAWTDEHLGTGGDLFQADASGDYRYRGDDPAAYQEAWDHEAGDGDEQPLIEFLDFVNNASDEEFASGLADRLDVESFATYLAIEELLGNFDDIDGPGNNSYLWFDADGVATVVAWDHNLALTGGFPGAVGGGGGAGAVPGGGDQQGLPGPVGPDGGLPLPEGCELPDGFDPGAVPGGGAGGPSLGGGNPLVDRFHEVDAFEALYQQALVDVRASLFDSGTASDLLEAEAQVLRDQASDLVDVATIDDEAASVEAQLDA